MKKDKHKSKIILFWNKICAIFTKIKNVMKKLIYSIFGDPIPKSKGIIGTSSGKLIMDKKVFYKREDVQETIRKIQESRESLESTN